MGKTTGFMEFPRRLPRRRPVSVRLRDWREVYEPFGEERDQGAGRPLHGLRHPLLPRRLPTGQPDPGVERPRLPRRLARRHGAPPRHEQLPRVHRAPVPGAVRGRLRARDQRGPGDDRADRVRDRRAGLGRGLGDASVAHGAHGQVRRRRGLGSGRPGRGPAAGAGRAPGDGLRAGGEARRPAPLRHPRVQDGEGGAGPPAGPDGGRGRDVRVLDLGGRESFRRGSRRWRGGRGARRGARPRHGLRARRHGPAGRRGARRHSTRSCWPAGPRCPGTCRCRAGSSTASTWPSST